MAEHKVSSKTITWFAYIGSRHNEDPIGFRQLVPAKEVDMGNLKVRPTEHYYSYFQPDYVRPYTPSTPVGVTTLLTEVEGEGPESGQRVVAESLEDVVDICAILSVVTGTPWRVYGAPALRRYSRTGRHTQLDDIVTSSELSREMLGLLFPFAGTPFQIPNWARQKLVPTSSVTSVIHTIHTAQLAEAISPSLALSALFTAIDGGAKIALTGTPHSGQQNRIRNAISLVRPKISSAAKKSLLDTRNSVAHDNIYSDSQFWRDAWAIADRTTSINLTPSSSAYLHYAMILPEVRDIARDLLSYALKGAPLIATRRDDSLTGPAWSDASTN